MGKWQMARIGDIASIQNGFAFDSKYFNNFNDGMPIIRIRDVKRGFTETYTNEDYKPSYVVKRGDILIGMDGEFNISEWKSEDALLNQRVCKLVADSINADSKYLFNILAQSLKDIEDSTPFVTVKHLSSKTIEDIVIPLPSLSIQQKIADALDKASALIEMRKAQIEKLDLLIKSQFIEMFGDPKENPKKWSVTCLDDVIDYIEAGWSANGDARTKLPNEYGVLKVSAVTSGEFDENEYKVINEDIKKVVYPHKGDLIFSRANTRELVGATCIIRRDYPMLLLPDKLWRVRFNTKATCQYMKYLLSSKSIRDSFSADSSGTSGSMYNISMQKFRSTAIILPPIAAQYEFSTLVDQVFEQKSLLQDSLSEFEINYRSLMQKCFSGEMF